jgi:hypothetical protein
VPKLIAELPSYIVLKAEKASMEATKPQIAASPVSQFNGECGGRLYVSSGWPGGCRPAIQPYPRTLPKKSCHA